MHDWRALVRERLAPLDLNASAESDLTEELAQHLEDRYRDLCSGGASDDDAFRESLAELDDMYRLRAGVDTTMRLPKHDVVALGEARSGGLFQGLGRDVRYALRAMRKSPSFVLFVVLTLALGIGANTTVFTVVHSLVLHLLPV